MGGGYSGSSLAANHKTLKVLYSTGRKCCYYKENLPMHLPVVRDVVAHFGEIVAHFHDVAVHC